jgi:hypothetical protein
LREIHSLIVGARGPDMKDTDPIRTLSRLRDPCFRNPRPRTTISTAPQPLYTRTSRTTPPVHALP